MINETYTLPILVTTGRARRSIQDTGAPMQDENAIAVRDKFQDVSEEELPNEDGCLSRSTTTKACDQIAADLLDYQHVILHVRLTRETLDSIDKEQLMKMPKRATLINMACLEEVHGGRDAQRLSARQH